MQDRAQDLMSNLKEIVRAWKAANDSVFTIHWKRIWPFKLLYPQTDYARVVRVLSKALENSFSQQAFLERELGKSGGSKELRDFYQTTLGYAKALAECCTTLSAVAQYRHDTIHAKHVHSIKAFDDLVVAYQEASARCVAEAQFCKLAYMAYEPKSSPAATTEKA